MYIKYTLYIIYIINYITSLNTVFFNYISYLTVYENIPVRTAMPIGQMLLRHKLEIRQS